MKKTVFITGATSGIGHSTAIAFAKAGYDVAICARSIDKIRLVEQDLLAFGNKVFGYELDINNLEGIKSVVKDLLSKVERIDVLVNNAGLARGLDPYHKNNFSEIAEVIDTNVKGLAYVTRAIMPSMVEHNTGHIINLGSTAGIYAYANGAVYCASKAAIKTLSDGIRIDAIDTDIKVTTIQPGIVETPFSEVRFRGDKEKAAKVYEGIEALQPEDIADIILYTASQPKRVQITDVTIMANQQGTGFNISRK